MDKFKKVKSLYDLDSVDAAAAYAKTNFKDAGGIILARNLEHISTEIFTQEYVDLSFLNMGITINNEGGWATSIHKLKLAVAGGFRESGSDTNTTGKITLNGEDDTIPVFTMDAESDWSEIQLKQAELQGINLPARLMEGHVEVYNRKIDDIGLFGQVRTDGSQKTRGLLNLTGISTDTAPAAAELLTGPELYAEISDLIIRQWSNVLNTAAYKANVVLLPDDVYNQATSKILNSAGSEMSVMSALRANYPGITFALTPKAQSVGGVSVSVAFSTNRRAMQFRLPVPLKISSVSQRGFKYYVESYFGVAGLDLIETGSIAYLTGL